MTGKRHSCRSNTHDWMTQFSLLQAVTLVTCRLAGMQNGRGACIELPLSAWSELYAATSVDAASAAWLVVKACSIHSERRKVPVT